jgi:tripartite-type tricarboxylate transporter receptor subunit TctC
VRKRIAQGFPDHEVRLVEPFGLGGGPDILARRIATGLAALWEQRVTVVNHSGDGSTAAPALVAKAPADGHTLLVNTSAHAYSATLARDLPYDPLADFVPIAPLTNQAYVLVAPATAGIATLSELISAARRRPGLLRFASSGVGTGTYLCVQAMNLEAGVLAVHLPPSSTDAITDTIAKTVAGNADYAVFPIPPAAPYFEDNRLVALAVSTARRSALLPDTPTIAEAGLPGFDFPIWYGVWAPSGTPPSVVEKIARDISRVFAAASMRSWLAEHGAEPITMEQPDFARFVLDESERAAAIIARVGTNPAVE